MNELRVAVSRPGGRTEPDPHFDATLNDNAIMAASDPAAAASETYAGGWTLWPTSDDPGDAASSFLVYDYDLPRTTFDRNPATLTRQLMVAALNQFARKSLILRGYLFGKSRGSTGRLGRDAASGVGAKSTLSAPGGKHGETR